MLQGLNDYENIQKVIVTIIILEFYKQIILIIIIYIIVILIQIFKNRYNYINNFKNSNISDNYNRTEAFYNKILKHIQRVKNKLQNIKIEKYNKMKEVFTFKPKINTNYKGFSNNQYNPKNIYQQQQIISQQGYKSIPVNANNISNISDKNIIEMKKNPL